MDFVDRGKVFFVLFIFLTTLVSGAAGAHSAVWYVDFDASYGGSGTSWGDPFNGIQPAVDSAVDGDEIWVREGRYANMVPNTIVAEVNKAVSIYGGFTGTETEQSQRDWEANPTVVDGTGWACRVFSISADAVIDGLTIKGGHAYNFEPPYDPTYNMGGGIFIDNETTTIHPRIRNCTITENQADFGGGIYVYRNSSVTIENCRIVGNTSDIHGAGIYINLDGSYLSASIRNSLISLNHAYQCAGGIVITEGMFGWQLNWEISNCTISDNISVLEGGGLYAAGMGRTVSARVVNTDISNNSSTMGGGGVYTYQVSPVFQNCLITGNQQNNYYARGGGGIYLGSAATLLNCTISGNTAQSYAGGLSFPPGTTVGNSIIWGNTSARTPSNPDIFGVYADSTWTFSNVNFALHPSDGTDGNINEDPLFAGAGDYRLGTGSGCIDAGDNTAVDASGSLELDGKPRFIDDPATTDTGSGTPPLVDMGAFEYGTPPADYDGDGIDNEVDGFHNGAFFVNEAADYSDNFTDLNQGGVTHGFFSDRSTLTMTVQDALTPEGVNVSAASGDSGTATVSACGYDMEFTAGDSAVVTCGSIEARVTDGTVLIHVAPDITVTVPAGARAVVEESGEGWLIGCQGTSSITVETAGGPSVIDPGGSESFVSSYADLTMAVSPTGSGTTTPDAAGSPWEVEKGAAQPISASASAGFRFDIWTADPSGNASFGDAGSSSTTVTLTGDVTVTAQFAATAVLTMAVNDAAGGGVDPDVGSQQVDEGLPVPITAAVNEGYFFDGWTAEPDGNASFGDSQAASTTVTLSGDAVVTANFSPALEMTMASSPPAGGTTTPPAGSQYVQQGVPQAVSASTAAGYFFTGWTAEPPGGASFGDSQAASTTVTLSGDAVVTANFIAGVSLTMASSPPSGGTTTPSEGTYLIEPWVAQTITANPAAGYVFSGWTAEPPENVSLADDGTATTLATLSGNATVTAFFDSETVADPGAVAGSPLAFVGSPASYSTSVSGSSLGHELEYRFDWDDGSYSEWVTGLAATTGVSHTWSSAGLYTVRAQARCVIHNMAVSGWSDPMTVTVANPALFTDDFSDGGWPGDPQWDKASGNWHVNKYGKLLSVKKKNNRAVVKEAELAPFSTGMIECDLKLTRRCVKYPNAGIIFAYQDNANYRWVRVKKGRIMIGQTGVFDQYETSGVKASTPSKFKVGKWHHIRVMSYPGGLVEVYAGAAVTPLLSYTFADGGREGRVGLMAYRAKSLFDDFTVFDETMLQ